MSQSIINATTLLVVVSSTISIERLLGKSSITLAGSFAFGDAAYLSLAMQNVCKATVVDINGSVTLKEGLQLMDIVLNLLMLLVMTFLVMIWPMIEDLLCFLMLGGFSMHATT